MTRPSLFRLCTGLSLAALLIAADTPRKTCAEDQTPPPAFKTTTDVAYDPAIRIGKHFKSLDIYAPATGENHPVVIWVHGGGWKIGDKRGVNSKPDAFTARGYLLVSINYRLHPQASYDQQAADIAQAIHWVYDHARDYGGNPHEMFLMGHSAGAHLVALVSTNPAYLKQQSLSIKTIKGTILIDGAGYDIADRIRTAKPTGQKLYTSVFGTDEAAWKDASPLTYVRKNQSIPPFLILHVASRADSKHQSQLLADKLKANRIPVQVVPAAGKTHTSINREIGQAGDLPTQRIFEFLDRITQTAKKK